MCCEAFVAHEFFVVAVSHITHEHLHVWHVWFGALTGPENVAGHKTESFGESHSDAAKSSKVPSHKEALIILLRRS